MRVSDRPGRTVKWEEQCPRTCFPANSNVQGLEIQGKPAKDPQRRGLESSVMSKHKSQSRRVNGDKCY